MIDNHFWLCYNYIIIWRYLIKLIQVEIEKYKCFQRVQTIEIDLKITTIVGMNESGKTSFLSALAKTNYFDETDNDFQFDITQDYPRTELIDFDGNTADKGHIISCTYELDNDLLAKINSDLGENIFSKKTFKVNYNYRGSKTISGVTADDKKFIGTLLGKYQLSDTTKSELCSLDDINKVLKIIKKDGDIDYDKFQLEIKKYANNPNGWNDLGQYIYTTYLATAMPKFWYFDDYYPLSGKIEIQRMKDVNSNSEQDKTAKALFELARIKPDEILSSTPEQYERFIALLEASANKITEEIFKYWTTNSNLDIEFKIQDMRNQQNQMAKFLDIRVKSQKYKVTLPLDRRSKGFNWFFSFIIWFSKIQSNQNCEYILLLDEPGLNLHASAQADLLRFINDLTNKYQIIYTTHSPFMVETKNLNRIRTCLETDNGTLISDSIQEKDPNTLFPLQAALGYDIAQNLFISKNNLLVEGPADLIYLTIFSNILEENNREYLKEDITIVPIGGLDKVTTFISLLRGSKLNVCCLLDNFKDQKNKHRLQDLISQKIIKERNIHFFNEFSSNGRDYADIEDLFEKEEYLKYFNMAFNGEYTEIQLKDLDDKVDTIIEQINKIIKKDRFNHYRPANKMNKCGVTKNDFSENTLIKFENIFKIINKLYE